MDKVDLFLFTVYFNDPDPAKRQIEADSFKIFEGRLILAIGDPNIVKNTVAMFDTWTYFTKDKMKVNDGVD